MGTGTTITVVKSIICAQWFMPLPASPCYGPPPIGRGEVEGEKRRKREEEGETEEWGNIRGMRAGLRGGGS